MSEAKEEEVAPHVESLDEVHRKFYEDQGYALPIKIHGRVCALSKFIYTTGIVVGMDETGYVCRYCYETPNEALTAFLEWMATGADEPTGYIKRKP